MGIFGKLFEKKEAMNSLSVLEEIKDLESSLKKIGNCFTVK